jgi:hypothetical protein
MVPPELSVFAVQSRMADSGRSRHFFWRATPAALIDGFNRLDRQQQ